MIVATIPRVSVNLGGNELPEEDLECLAGLRVHRRMSLPTLCEMSFHEPSQRLLEGIADLPGTAVRVRLEEHRGLFFSGDVTAVEQQYEPDGGVNLRLRAYDILHRLRKRQPVRSHIDVTVADLARELVEDLGIAVEAADPGPVWRRLVQCRQTDWEFLSDLAERCGLYPTLREDALHLLTLEGTGTEIPLVLGETLFEAQFEVNSEAACRNVEASGWNPLRVELHGGRATSPRLGRSVPAEAPADRVGGENDRTLVDLLVHDDRQAEALAQGRLDFCAATEVLLWGVADGNPEVGPGTRAVISGVAEAFAGRYVLTETEHTLGLDSGFVSRISTAPLPVRPRPYAAVATHGEVTGVDDPDRLGRVKVVLPTYGGLETDWMGVVTTGAGEGKGLVALPDVGDLVLVLFAGEDLAQGVVVGGLYGTVGPPDETVSGEMVYRYTFMTPGGQRIRLDDQASKLTVENSTGSVLEIGPEAAMLHFATPLTIEAPGQSVRIRGSTIDFETA